MSLEGDRRGREAFSSSLVMFVIFELVVWVMVVAFFVWLLGVADVRVVLGLLAARGGVAVIQWRRALAPIHAWRQQQRDSEGLLAAERAFARFYRHFGLSYAGGWVVAGAAAISLGAGGIPEPLPVGAPEQLAGILGLFGMGLGVASVMRPLCDAYLLDVRAQLGAALLEHGSGARAVSEAIGPRLLLFNVALLVAVVLGLLPMYVLEHAAGERERLQAELRGRTLDAAWQLRVGEPFDQRGDDTLELVDLDQLPGVFEVDARASDELLSRISFHQDQVLVAAPVGDGRWVLARADVELGLGRLTVAAVVFLSLMSLVVGIANAILNRTVTDPLEQLDDAVRHMAEQGDIRALARVVPLRSDEIGALSSNFNGLLNVLEALAGAAGKVAEGQLDVEIEGSGDLQDAFAGMLERLHAMVLQVRSSALEVARGASEIQSTTKAQGQVVEQQSQRALELEATIATLARSAAQISGAADEVLDNAEQTLGTTRSMAEEIDELGRQADKVAQLLSQIREIADRSDLLALNGSLEATRAGEAGRGFALVAAEMRRLAERVTGTVIGIGEQLAGMSAASASTVAATDRSRTLAEGTAAAARRISTITREQTEKTEGVSAEVGGLVDDVSATIASTSQTHQAAEGLRRQAAELERMTAQFSLRDPGGN